MLSNPSVLEQVAELGRRCPETILILDHLGGPAISEGTQSPQYDLWKAGMRQLAKRPRTYVKISGAPGEAAHGVFGNWTVEQVAPFMRDTVDIFGVEKCFFAGNWFFLDLAGTYVSWASAVKQVLLEGATNEFVVRLLRGTAAEAYRISDSEWMIEHHPD